MARVSCPVCEKPFNARAEQVRMMMPPCCSNKCRGLAKRKNNHPPIDGYAACVNGSGYVCLWIPDRGLILYHRYIMEKVHGIDAVAGMDVHHIDGSRDNNSLSNLVIVTHREHFQLHAKARLELAGGVWGRDKICAHCKSVLPISNFGRRKTTWDRLNATCKPCRNAAQRARNKKNREKRNATQ